MEAADGVAMDSVDPHQQSGLGKASSLFAIRDTAGFNSAVTSWVLSSAAPSRATIMIVLPGYNTALSEHLKLSRKRRLVRLRATALPIRRETANPSRAAS
jgi:hypothetical protein